METYEVHITQTVERTIMVKSHSQAEAESKALERFFTDPSIDRNQVTRFIVSSIKLS